MRYHQIGHTAYHHVGAVPGQMPQISTARKVLGWVAVGAATYHGYRRNQSVGWAIGWAVAAGFAPIITTGIAVAQGFGKRKGR